ncbi:uncharacterized protein LOC112128401 [Cimex lectularius]|uniref:Endonuclease/exonuclease/phosphatase domain-containing protein n=1 Tax=Cimex lectularius TaxID=79782 RepID=A0A8I6SUB6_CIMLE|nr:uncharacterized protein LOC112128401 [Cimex lectularius]
MYAIRTKILNKVQFSKLLDSDVIRLSCDDFDIHLVPVYLSCSSWEGDLEILRDALGYTPSLRYILMGNFNARIGEAQSLTEDLILENDRCSHSRKSKDGIINANGRSFLDFCSDFGLLVSNGRFDSDSEGELTYLSTVGCTVIDYCCVSLDCISLIDGFSVLPEYFSDHLPLSLSLSCRTLTERTPPEELPKLSWNPKFAEVYRERLGGLLPEMDCCEENHQLRLNALVAAIKSAFPIPNPAFSMLRAYKNPWFDNHCWRLRGKLFALLNLFRKSSDESVCRALLHAKREFKQLCLIKKKEFYISSCKQLGAASDSREFWRLANSFKRGSSWSSNNISLQSWKSYFESQLNPSVLINHISYCEPYILDPFLDSPFSYDELKSVISQLKNNKAPGQEGVPFEFYKNAPDSFLIKLLSLFNAIYESGVVPSSFGKSIISPLYKKGNRDEVANYRGISCID